MTWSLPGRVRIRLAAWYVVSIVVLVSAYTAVVILMVQQQARHELDAELTADLATFVDRFVLELGTPNPGRGADSFDHAEAGQSTVDVWRLDPPTKRLSQGRRLRGREGGSLPVPQWHPQEAVGFDVIVDGQAARAMQATVDVAGRGAHLLQVSQPMTVISEMTDALLMNALWAMAGLLVVSCAGGFMIAGAALSPIRRIIDTTRAIRPGDLSTRLPVHAPADELAELAKVINALLADTQAALNKQAQFATETAHELRTPLTAQRSVGELALRGQASAETLREALFSMLEEGEHMQKLIESLLTVASADGGLLPGQPALLDAAVLADRCVRSMSPLAEQNDQVLAMAAQDGAKFIADETLVRQALLNLIHNAIVHTPAATRISVEVAREARDVVLRVVDTGPGIPSFEASQTIRRQSRKGLVRGFRGLGLGLSIAQSLVRSQGGRLSVHSTQGLGTEIELRFEAFPRDLGAARGAGFEPATLPLGRRRGD